MTSQTRTLTAPLAVAARVPWRAAAPTAFAAVLFGRLNAVLYDNERIYQLDREAAVLIPVVVAVALALFAIVSSRALRASAKTNRPARAALVCGILAPLAFPSSGLASRSSWAARAYARLGGPEAVAGRRQPAARTRGHGTRRTCRCGERRTLAGQRVAVVAGPREAHGP